MRLYAFICITGGEDVVLKRGGAVFCVNDVTGLLFEIGDPFSELPSVGNGSCKTNVVQR